MALSDTDSVPLQDFNYESVPGGTDFDDEHSTRESQPTDTKRCMRCSAYYRDTDLPAQLECHFHTGKFKTVLTLHTYGVTTGKWTCCKSDKVNSLGCNTGHHVEDKTTTQLLNRFNSLSQEGSTSPSQVAVSQPVTPASPSSSSTSSLTTPNPVSQQPLDIEYVQIGSETYIKHPVSTHDTIWGLALKYNTKAAILKRVNKLFDDKEIYSKAHVLVPCPKDAVAAISLAQANIDSSKRDDLVKKFKREFNVTKEEASFYLSEQKYSWDAAVKQFKEDLKAEENLNKKKN